MNRHLKIGGFFRILILFLAAVLLTVGSPDNRAAAQVSGLDVLYTTDADFDQGTLVSVNHDAPFNDQLQLDSPTEPFPFINVAASGRGTVVRSNTETGQVVGEYHTAPEGRGLNPSRTTVDLFGNVWTANRNEADFISGVPHGSAVKIGLIVGGTRVDGTGSPDPNGGYLAPPFAYNTCVDRDADGLIRTSNGLADVLDWPDITDGAGGADGLVEDAQDECILIYQRLYEAENARHVSVDADNNVWVGGYPFAQRMFYKLDGATGAVLDSFDTRDIGCGGYGGLIDGNDILWSVGGPLLRYDPATRSGFCIHQYGYGLGIDTNGYIWMSIWDGGIVKIAPDGTVVAGFPKPIYPPSMTTTTRQSPAPAQPVPVVLEQPRDQEAAAITPLANGDPLSFQAAPQDEWVQSGGGWTPGTTVSLTIEDGSGVLYSDSQTVDGDGNFHFGFWDVFDLQRGHLVSITDGTTTKTLVVADLYADGLDVAADTVFGRAAAGSSVDVWVSGDGQMTVTADGGGNWTANFSGMTDLTYLSDGGSQQFDDDGDSTFVWWEGPKFQVAPENDWVQSYSRWTPGTTVSLTIADGSGVLYSDSQTVDPYGNFNFNLWDVFDLQRGHVVTVSDGTATKTHTVLNLYVDGFDVTADTVFGRAAAGSSVDVWVHGDGGLNTTADGAGNWTADFSGITDLTYLSDGGSQQQDDDGDSTGVWWEYPRIDAAPVDDWVQSSNRWTPGATISLTIEDGSGVVHSDSQTADAHGYFHFSLWDVFDLQRGHIITVSDGTNTKSHTVTDLYVDAVDVAADTVSGRAAAGSDVKVKVHGDGEATVTADGSEIWTADFSGITDLTYLSEGSSQQTDDDGDSTWIWWTGPRIQAAPDDDWVSSWSRWTPGTTISLTIEDGSGVVYSDSQTSDADGNFNFNLWDVFDLQRGHVVSVSDGTKTKTLVVADLYVDGVDVTTDTVFGRAAAGGMVDVWVHGDGGLTTTTDGSGNWTADFSGMADLTYFSDGGSQQFDDDGDATGVWWASPRFQVAPDEDSVSSWSRWTPGATISLTIEDSGGEVYSASRAADSHGYFHFDLWDVFDLQRGHIVTVSDGTNTKTHTVLGLYVDGVDVTADTVFGRAAAGSMVEVWVHGDGGLTTTADGSGNWTADFSGLTDLTYQSDGGSQQFDDDGDGTGVWWAIPSFRVSPEEDWVEARHRWTPGAEITLTVADGGGVIYYDSQTADAGGHFHFNIWAVDLMSSHLVTISDGTTTKSHVVTGVGVTDIDADADQIHGTANSGAQVQVWVSLFEDSSGRWVTADLSGNWTADFSLAADGQPAYDITNITRIDIEEFDDHGDTTWRRFGPPVQQNRGVAVTPLDNHVWVANSGVRTVTRLDNDGNVLKVIMTGDVPTGVAVDAAGKVWATNLGSDNAVRIDPNAGPDGLGAVDLTVDLGPWAHPYNYSDMTGAVVVGSTSPQGFWTVIQDSETTGFEWGRVTWNREPQGSEPPGTAIVVEARAADTETGLGGLPFQPVTNGDLFSLFGRFIEVRVTLKASPAGASPVLADIRIQPHVLYVDIDIKPGSFPNAINCENRKEVIAVAILTTDDFDARSVDHTTVLFEGASEIHREKKSGEPRRHEEDVDFDGDIDLVIHVRFSDTVLTCASFAGTLTGELYDGLPIEGTDSIFMVGDAAVPPVSMYIPYISSGANYGDVVDAASMLAEMLKDELGVGVMAVVPPGDPNESMDATVQAVAGGQGNLTLLPWLQTLMLYQNATGQPAVGVIRFGRAVYNGQFLANDQSGITDLADLQGRHICWADPQSMSGYIIPDLMLLRAGITPASSEFAGGHTSVVQRIYTGACESGAAFLDARDLLDPVDYPDVMDIVLQLEQGISPDIPNGGFLFGANFPQSLREPTVAALVAFAADPGSPEFSVFEVLQPGMDGLQAVDQDLYLDIEQLLADAGMTPEEVWDHYLR